MKIAPGIVCSDQLPPFLPDSVDVVPTKDVPSSPQEPDIEASMNKAFSSDSVSATEPSVSTETVVIVASEEKPSIEATTPPAIITVSSMPVKMETSSTSKATPEKSSSSSSASKASPVTSSKETLTPSPTQQPSLKQDSLITRTITRTIYEEYDDEEEGEEEEEVEEVRQTESASPGGESEIKVSSSKSDSQSSPPSTEKGASGSEGISPGDSSDQSPLETMELESSMVSPSAKDTTTTAEISFGQLGTASLLEDGGGKATKPSLPKVEMTTQTLTINPSDLPTFTTQAGHFLGHRAPPSIIIVGPAKSQDNYQTTEDDNEDDQTRPSEDPNSPPSNLGIGNVPSAELPVSNLLDKGARRADALPDMNDILSGLLNVVGEGLNIATNYVKEEANRKDGDSLDNELAPSMLLPFRTRINNRGPPRFTEIPFEAIPLEVLKTPRPGEQPAVQIQQRPFKTRIKVTRTRQRPKLPIATGIPLPELLIPLEEGQKLEDFHLQEEFEKLANKFKPTPPTQIGPVLFPAVIPNPPRVGGEEQKEDNEGQVDILEHTYFPTRDEDEETTTPVLHISNDGVIPELLSPGISTTESQVPTQQRPPLQRPPTFGPQTRPPRPPPKRRPRPPSARPPPKLTSKATTTSTTTSTTETTNRRTTPSPATAPTRTTPTPARLPPRPTPPLEEATTPEKLRPGIVIDPLQDPITGRPIIGGGGVGGKPDIFDVTVTALQNFGQGSIKPFKPLSGKAP